MTDGSVAVRQFARVFVDTATRLPPSVEAYKADDGRYFYHLGLDSVSTADAETLLKKASERFDVEPVAQVLEGETVVKERRYVESVTEVPEEYEPQQGPMGGIYYEAEPREAGVTDDVAYSGEPVLAVQLQDVESGMRIAFEHPDGTRDMGEVASIDPDEGVVDVRSGNGLTEVAAAGFDLEAEKAEGSDGGGTVTSDTAGVHSARYSPEDEEEDGEDLEVVGKREFFGADVFRVLPPEDGDDDFDGDLIGIGIDFPNDAVYVDWRNEAFPDPLEESHVSIYGSIADLEQATGNRTEHLATVGSETDDLTKLHARLRKDCDGHHVGPCEEDGLIAGEDEILCEPSGEAFHEDEARHRGGHCPWCGEDVHDELVAKHFLTKEDEGVWTYYYGPKGGEGWINVLTGEKRYQKERPGQAPEGGDGYGDWLADGWTDAPEDPAALMEGQQVEVFYDGEYREAVVDGYEDGEVMLDDEHTDIPYSATEVEVTAAEELGEHHPATEHVVLEPEAVNGEVKDYAAEYEPGDDIYLDMSQVDAVDEPAAVEQVMGYNQATGDLNIYPPDGILEEEPDADTIRVSEDPIITPEEYEQAMSGQLALEEHGLEVGDEVVIEETYYDEFYEGEIVDPIDGEVAVETEDGATWFPFGNDDAELFTEDDEYAYSPKHFDFHEEVDMGSVEYDDAVWVNGDGPFRVQSAPHPSDQWVSVFDYADPESDGMVPLENVDAWSPVTPPSAVGWWREDVSPTEGDAEDTADAEPEAEGETPSEDQIVPEATEADSAAMDIHPSLNHDADPEEFVSMVERFGEEHEDLSVMLTFHDAEELAEHDLFLSEDGDAGVAVSPDGDIQNVISWKDAEVSGDDVMEAAKAAGGETLDCYDGFLRDFYEDHGFDVTGTIGFNPEYAPEGWEENPHLRDQPDVMFMAHAAGDIGEVPEYDGSEWAQAKDDSKRAAGTGEDDRPEGGRVGEGERGGDPAAGADGGAGGVDPPEPSAGFDPDSVDEYRPMSDIGANHGNSVSAMEVAVMPDGSKYVQKDVGHISVEPGDIEREVAGYHAAKHLDPNVPEHEADVAEGWAASEVVPGVDAKDATPAMKEAVDHDDFAEMAATQLIIGNSDLHQNNVRVDEDGNLYPFDLDRAGGDLQGEWVGQLTAYENTLDRIFGELEKSATALGVDLDRQAVLERAEQEAAALDDDTVNTIMSDVMTHATDDLAATIVDNIEALQAGEVTL